MTNYDKFFQETLGSAELSGFRRAVHPAEHCAVCAVQQAVWLYSANSWGNVLDNIICILFAYCTNRAFVFRSKTQGKAMAREFGAFVTCRLGTMLLDTAIMLVLGNLLAAQGAALMDELMQGVLSVVAHWLGPDTAIQMAASYAGTPRGSRMVLPLLPSSAVQTAPRQSSLPAATMRRHCGGLCVKVFSNVVVVVLNYVFSKLIIFKKK